MPEPRICTFTGCGYEHYALGLCLAHYRMRRRGLPLRTVKRRRTHLACSFPECERTHRAKGLCFAHYTQLRRGDPLTPVTQVPKAATCAFPECARPYLAKGWCAGHYSQYREGRPMSPLRPVNPGRGCAVPSCAAKHYALGLCKNHARKCGAYGVTPEELVLLEAATNCDCCGGPWGTDRGSRPCIDHDHTTGKIRGVVHGNCNLGLGHFGDAPEKLMAAHGYTQRHRAPRQSS